jgi:hypothetical protein
MIEGVGRDEDICTLSDKMWIEVEPSIATRGPNGDR